MYLFAGLRMNVSPNLSDLSTIWSDLRAAHGSDAAAARTAQDRLLDRYLAAVKRYL
jgi:hypothetical protein